jgi:hypothetical protein
MVKPAKLQGRKLAIVLTGKSGPSLMNQAAVWLLADSWSDPASSASGGLRRDSQRSPSDQPASPGEATAKTGADMPPAVGYEVLLYGEGAKRLSVYRYEQRKSIEIARFDVGPAVHADHEYVIQRDEAGNWSASVNDKPLPHGAKDRGTPDITFQDATYSTFAFVGIHFNSAESELNEVKIKAD